MNSFSIERVFSPDSGGSSLLLPLIKALWCQHYLSHSKYGEVSGHMPPSQGHELAKIRGRRPFRLCLVVPHFVATSQRSLGVRYCRRSEVECSHTCDSWGLCDGRELTRSWRLISNWLNKTVMISALCLWRQASWRVVSNCRRSVYMVPRDRGTWREGASMIELINLGRVKLTREDDSLRLSLVNYGIVHRTKIYSSFGRSMNGPSNFVRYLLVKLFNKTRLQTNTFLSVRADSQK